MKIAGLFQTKTVFSFEVFPPKKTGSLESVYGTLEELQKLKPDFVSVTYGAGGSGARNLTCEIAARIRQQYGMEAAAHVTCIGASRESVSEVLTEFQKNGIENILALRGDWTPELAAAVEGKPVAFSHASDLIAFIREQEQTGRWSFDIAGACYPEGHPETEEPITDVLHLRKKVEAGADHLISQLFFDNQSFYTFRERARLAGITVPIEAGIMPVVNKNQIERMVSLCGASLPAKFSKMMSRYESSPEALRDAGIAYAIDQIVDLISNRVDGIHLYTMNNPYVARRITEAVSSLLSADICR